MSGYRSPDASSLDSSANPTPNYASTPVNEVDQLQVTPEIGLTSPLARFDRTSASDDSENAIKACPSSVRRPTFSNASSISVDSHHGVHIILPGSAFHSSSPASIKSLSHCVVDMSVPTNGDKSYASLTINDVQKSLLICGQVEGPAHITDVEHSVIVVSCRQFRMHKCSNIDVYLSCSSNPIIEDCSNIRFARIPRVYVS
jgi:tubulin-specific chaperone C